MSLKLVGAYAVALMAALFLAGCGSDGTNYDLASYYRWIDYSCAEDSDCEIKDIHNCCGFYPLCVNSQSVADPGYVEAACLESGRPDVCGYPAIVSCSCLSSICRGVLNDGSVVDFNPLS